MGHMHSGGWGDGGCTEIAPNVCLRPVVHGGDPDVTNIADGSIAGGPVEHLAGFIVAHDRDGFADRCEGAVTTDPDIRSAAKWSMSGTLEGGDLTLSPSILCRLGTASVEECGFHGFVRDGKWVLA